MYVLRRQRARDRWLSATSCVSDPSHSVRVLFCKQAIAISPVVKCPRSRPGLRRSDPANSFWNREFHVGITQNSQEMVGGESVKGVAELSVTIFAVFLNEVGMKLLIQNAKVFLILCFLNVIVLLLVPLEESFSSVAPSTGMIFYKVFLAFTAVFFHIRSLNPSDGRVEVE